MCEGVYRAIQVPLFAVVCGLVGVAAGCATGERTAAGPLPAVDEGSADSRAAEQTPATGSARAVLTEPNRSTAEEAKRATERVVSNQSEAQMRSEVIGESVRGEELVLHVFGTGAERVLIFGGIHGSEPQSVHVAEQLLALLRAEPGVYAGKQVGLITVLNPDGYAKRVRWNDNGVDLNRNFPTANFKSGTRRGSRPASEPETRALLTAMERLGPARVCAIHAIYGPRQCNNFDGPAEHLAAAMAAENGYPVVPDIGYATPGSFGTWAGHERGIPVITLEIPQSASGAEAWAQNRAALLAFIAGAERSEHPE